VSKQNTKAVVRGAMVVAGCMGLALAWACSSSSGSPGVLGDLGGQDSSVTGGDASAADSGQDSSQDGGFVCKQVDGGCASLAQCSKQVPIVEVAASAPAPTGGTVTQGTYVLVDYTVFTGAGGGTGKVGWFTDTMLIGTPGQGDAGAGDAGAGDADDDGGDLDGGEAGADDDGGALDGGEAGTDAGSGNPELTYSWLDVTQSDTAPLSTVSGNITFTPPSSAGFADFCPTSSVFGAQYSSSPTQLVLYYPGPNDMGTVQATYTLL
jgi:hypothetical protein